MQRIQSNKQENFRKKKFVVKDDWSQWIKNVLDEIIEHDDLEKLLFNKQKDFFLEDVYHCKISEPDVHLNQIKKYLHEILTEAIFEKHPCKELLLVFQKKKQPSKEKWSSDVNFWLSLNADPYPKVSEIICCLLFLLFV